MNQRKNLQISVTGLLLLLLVFSCFFGVWRALQQASHYRAEVDRLRKLVPSTESRAHPEARLEVIRSGESMSSPDFLAGEGQWFGGNLTVSDAARNIQHLSYKGRYVYSVARADVYLFVWSKKSRLPPVPSLNNLDGQYALVSIGEGDNTIMKDDFWEIKIVAPGKTNR